MFAKVPLEWFCLPDAQHKVLGVLLCHGSDKPVYPSVARIARYCGFSPRHVIRTMNELKRLGFIVEVPGRQRRVKQYSIADTRVTLHSQKLLGEEEIKGDAHVTLPQDCRVTFETSKGDTGVTRSCDLDVTPNLQRESIKKYVRTDSSKELEERLLHRFERKQIAELLRQDHGWVTQCLDSWASIDGSEGIGNPMGYLYNAIMKREDPYGLIAAVPRESVLKEPTKIEHQASQLRSGAGGLQRLGNAMAMGVLIAVAKE